MTSDTHLSLHLAHRLREEANEAFNQDDFATSLKLYTDGLDALDQPASPSPAPHDTSFAAIGSNQSIRLVDSMRSLRLTFHSNLAETYLRLGMGHMARDHCNLALTIDEEDRAVHERLHHAERMIKHHRGKVGKVVEKLGSIETAQKATWFSAMVEVAKELTELIEADEVDPHLTVKSLLAAAQSDMVLANALLQEAPAGKAAKIVAKSHFSKCGDLYEEASSTCMPYCDPSGAFGFDGSDTSEMACESRWRANILFAKAEFKHGKTLMSIQLLDSALCPFNYVSALNAWDDNGRASLYNRLALVRQHLSTGLDALQSLDCADEVPGFLKGRKLVVEVEILLQLLSIDRIGLELRDAKQRAAAIETAIKTVLRPGMAAKGVVAVCDDLKRSHKSLLGSNERSAFPIASHLLSACVHAYMIAGATRMQIDMLRQLIQGRRMNWISQAAPSYASTSNDDAREDTANILQLIKALRKTGREVEEECPICYEPLFGSEGGVVKPLSCGHFFHHGCCQRYYTCSRKVSERDLSRALTGQRIIRELPCPTCRKMHSMRVLRDGSFSEVY